MWNGGSGKNDDITKCDNTLTNIQAGGGQTRK